MTFNYSFKKAFSKIFISGRIEMEKKKSVNYVRPGVIFEL